MKKTLLIAVALACVTLLASVAEAVPQKSSAAAHKRRASHQKSQPQSIALDRPPLDESAVKWSCEHNKAFWLSGDFKSDPSLTLYWSGRNYLLPRANDDRRRALSGFRQRPGSGRAALQGNAVQRSWRALPPGQIGRAHV